MENLREMLWNYCRPKMLAGLGPQISSNMASLRLGLFMGDSIGIQNFRIVESGGEEGSNSMAGDITGLDSFIYLYVTLWENSCVFCLEKVYISYEREGLTNECRCKY